MLPVFFCAINTGMYAITSPMTQNQPKAQPYVYLNTYDAAGITLSSDQLTITPLKFDWDTAWAHNTKSSGKWCFEVTWVSGGSNVSVGIGVSQTNYLTNGLYIGENATSWGYLGDGYKANNGFTNISNAIAVTKTAMFLIDIDAGSCTIIVEGGSTTTMFTGQTFGTVYPGIASRTNGGACIQKANFGSEPFVNTPLAGYLPWYRRIDSDPYFSSVVLLLPLNGSDAATSTTDLSNDGHTITFNGNAQLDTAQAKFGASSALFDGTSDYLSIPDATNLSPVSSSFTVECHVRFNGDPTTSQRTFVSKWNNGGFTTAKEWWLGYRNNSIQAFHSSSGSNGLFSLNKAWNPDGDTWYHIAYVIDRDLATDAARVFVDGVQLGTDDTTINATATIPDSASQVWIGGYDDDANDWFNGWIDNVRITKGIVRYTGNFTPPSAEYPTS